MLLMFLSDHFHFFFFTMFSFHLLSTFLKSGEFMPLLDCVLRLSHHNYWIGVLASFYLLLLSSVMFCYSDVTVLGFSLTILLVYYGGQNLQRLLSSFTPHFTFNFGKVFIYHSILSIFASPVFRHLQFSIVF